MLPLELMGLYKSVVVIVLSREEAKVQLKVQPKVSVESCRLSVERAVFAPLLQNSVYTWVAISLNGGRVQ